jgi:hypothetical protein
MSFHRVAVVAGVAFMAIVVQTTRGGAHKPITSPYLFTPDVLPILTEHCAACHVPGGAAPMSLVTYAETVPWGASMRLELIAGHMPPWTASSSVGRLRNAGALSARELNVLMTWLSGGTPEGEPSHVEAANVGAALRRPIADARTATNAWPLGEPDVSVPLPEVVLGVDTQEQKQALTVPAHADERWIRAIDLRPGTPSIVRSAVVRTPAGRALALWQPGDPPVAAQDAAMRVPPHTPLVVEVRYRKGWDQERVVVSDRSTLGLYLSPPPTSELRAVALGGHGMTLRAPLRVAAVSPDIGMPAARVVIEAVRPNGRRDTLIAFKPRPEWRRRYWFDAPIDLPRGTRLEMRTTPPAPTATVTLDVLAVRGGRL